MEMNLHPKIKIFAVYKTGEGDWRGFCVPFDVSCNAPTVGEAQSRLEKLVELYEEGLEKYDYPKHLSFKELSNPDDQSVLKTVLKEIAEQIRSKIEYQFMQYQVEKEKKYSFRIDKNVRGYYLEPA